MPDASFTNSDRDLHNQNIVPSLLRNFKRINCRRSSSIHPPASIVRRSPNYPYAVINQPPLPVGYRITSAPGFNTAASAFLRRVSSLAYCISSSSPGWSSFNVEFHNKAALFFKRQLIQSQLHSNITVILPKTFVQIISFNECLPELVGLWDFNGRFTSHVSFWASAGVGSLLESFTYQQVWANA